LLTKLKKLQLPVTVVEVVLVTQYAIQRKNIVMESGFGVGTVALMVIQIRGVNQWILVNLMNNIYPEGFFLRDNF
jgi:hypothetical protein